MARWSEWQGRRGGAAAHPMRVGGVKPGVYAAWRPAHGVMRISAQAADCVGRPRGSACRLAPATCRAPTAACRWGDAACCASRCARGLAAATPRLPCAARRLPDVACRLFAVARRPLSVAHRANGFTHEAQSLDAPSRSVRRAEHMARRASPNGRVLAHTGRRPKLRHSAHGWGWATPRPGRAARRMESVACRHGGASCHWPMTMGWSTSPSIQYTNTSVPGRGVNTAPQSEPV